MLKYFKDIYKGVITPLQGMKITSKYIFTPRVTRKYPEAYTPVLPPSERNKLEVDIDTCIGCKMCAKACPAKCISIETMKNPAANSPAEAFAEDKNAEQSPRLAKKLIITKFDIDFGLCCFCTLCEEACPSKSIHRTAVFDYSTYYRKELRHKFVNNE